MLLLLITQGYGLTIGKEELELGPVRYKPFYDVEISLETPSACVTMCIETTIVDTIDEYMADEHIVRICETKRSMIKTVPSSSSMRISLRNSGDPTSYEFTYKYVLSMFEVICLSFLCLIVMVCVFMKCIWSMRQLQITRIYIWYCVKYTFQNLKTRCLVFVKTPVDELE